MSNPFLPRNAANLSQATHRLLNMYTLAATAAGVGMMASGQTSEAKIVYTPKHMKFGRNAGLNLDLNHDGVVDFVLANTYSNFGNRISYRMVVSAYNQPDSNSMRGHKEPRALRAGARIGSGEEFSHFATRMAHFYTYSGSVRTSSGPWKNVKNRYLGLKFQIHGKTHYGWARLSVTVHARGVYGISALLTGYAYETIPGKSIRAGQTKETEKIEAGSISLGRLALGAAATGAPSN